MGIGRGADLRAPLAISVIGGLVVATLLTLIVVPVLFSVVEQMRVAIAGEPELVRGAAPGGASEAAASEAERAPGLARALAPSEATR
jgi:hypothetical protein